jgi:hypothetical protein
VAGACYNFLYCIKPLELLSGANLLYLLAENAGINARIVVPDEWRDPVADSSDESSVSG